MDITEQLTHESRIALAAAAEITRLRARLEVRDDGGPDGILCRDESIRMQDAEIARLRAEVEALRADAVRLDCGQIMIDTRDEFGEPTQVWHTGMDLRKAIDAARAAQGVKP